MRTYGFSVHLQSRPSWARGLKFEKLGAFTLETGRAPRGRVD